MSKTPLPEGFVCFENSNIIVDLKYFGSDNFVGRRVEGYRSPGVILTKEAASALEVAINLFSNDGYKVVIYDAYRPSKAVKFFKNWAVDSEDQKMKKFYYPYVDKKKLFELGFVAFEKSTHSRGSTIDLTIIKNDKNIKKIEPVLRTISDARELYFLDDNTIDMGSSFDIFDSVSHVNSDLISLNQKENRDYLKRIMLKAGFEGLETEWWHFTLKNEPFPETYFDFDVI